MQEYKIFKCIGKMIPASFGEVYYGARLKYFHLYACSLFTDGDKVWVEGPDEVIKNKLEERLERNKGHLFYDYNMRGVNENGNKIYALCTKPILPSDPNFPDALHDTLIGFISGESYHTGDIVSDVIKVNSIEDVQRLDREMEEKRKVA